MRSRAINVRRGIRHILGIFAATFCVLFLLSALVFTLKPDPEIPSGGVIVISVIGIFFGAASAWLLRKTIAVKPAPCPQCGAKNWKRAGLLLRRRNWPLRFLGGWLVEALWAGNQENQVQCNECGSLYFTKTGGSLLWGVALWVFLLLWLMGALAERFIPAK